MPSADYELPPVPPPAVGWPSARYLQTVIPTVLGAAVVVWGMLTGQVALISLGAGLLGTPQMLKTLGPQHITPPGIPSGPPPRGEEVSLDIIDRPAIEDDL